MKEPSVLDQATAYRAGILLARHHFSRRRVAASLPAEHRITAERDDEAYVAYMVEGPSLPVVAVGDMPCEVRITFTMIYTDPGFRLAAAWNHDPDHSWIVGSWPDLDSYRQDMEALDHG